MKNVGVRFDNRLDRAFTTELKARVADHFREQGRSRRAPPGMWIKAAVMVSLVFGPWALILFGGLPLWAMWLCCVALGIGVAGYGFGVMHDAMHGAYSKNRVVTAVLGLIFDFTGASSYLWRLRHNRMHHAYTNLYGADVDLDANWILRFSPYSGAHPVQRYQHLYFPFAYAISSLHWMAFKDYKSLSRRSHGCFREVTHTPARVAEVLGLKALHYVNFIVLPLVLLDITVGQFLVGFLTLHVVTGLLMTCIFQVTHNTHLTGKHESVPGACLDRSWMAHELDVTANFACDNRALTWFVGGLNHHIEHHLFPTIASAHYPALRPIVKAVAAKHGLPYHEFATFREAFAGHQRLLKELGTTPPPAVIKAQEAAAAR